LYVTSFQRNSIARIKENSTYKVHINLVLTHLLSILNELIFLPWYQANRNESMRFVTIAS